MPLAAKPRSRPIRIRKLRAASLLVVVAAVAAALGDQVSSSSPAAEPSELVQPGSRSTGPGRAGALGEAGGAVPEGVTAFDDAIPAVANLDPELAAALRRAAAAAAADGFTVVVDGGWRSRAYQAYLLREAISKYGSAEEAARWVATPETSSHVSGDAVDVGHADAAAWLSEHGAVYGLCQVYENEPWHYELRPDAMAHGCPPKYADPTHDPRLR